MKAADMFSLKGKVALVTGASSGLGTQFAKALADNGAAVALVARRAERLKALKGEIEGKGGKAIAIEADVTDRAAMTRAFDSAEKAFGTVTILVNNAGIAHGGRAVEMAPEEWRRVLSTNLDSVFFWAQEAARRILARNKHGAIVNIASVLGLAVSKGAVAYAAAKAGVVQVTKALAVELAFKGVRVNAIAPGWFVTEMNDEYLTARPALPSSARFRWDVLAIRATSTALCCCSPPTRQLHHRRDDCRRRRPGDSDQGVSMDFTLSPKLKTSGCVYAHLSKNMFCRSRPTRKISPSTRTSLKRGWRKSAKRRRKLACGPHSHRRSSVAWTCRSWPGRPFTKRPRARFRAACVQLHGARRRQHERAQAGRHAANRKKSG
jgi:3-oxoacyl-[acyl-carrier protein] reductase